MMVKTAPSVCALARQNGEIGLSFGLLFGISRCLAHRWCPIPCAMGVAHAL